MWWVLFAVILLISWATWVTFSLNIAIPIATSIVVVLSAAALLVFRRILPSHAGARLEQAIFKQGAQQTLGVRPERRPEIEELQRQVQSGISALKGSKLGKSRRGGDAALYSLPWYVIIGPPGAGKTTALKHSGLVFPYVDPRSGGGVRGVGGTRNCDWWFTNEAILLDTAGRYATERDDHDEWMAFLEMLLRYRKRCPLNGIIVAVGVAELIEASEQQIDEMANRLRTRISEVMNKLEMVLPVYLLFTKCDRIAGFTQFFGDMRRSDRAHAWGATLKLNADRSHPGRLFDAEFDALIKQVHARALKRVVMERNREARERIYQFPLELWNIRRNLSRLVTSMFVVNAYRGTPIFRGFYLTSGTQEGIPNSRLAQSMRQRMGIRSHKAAPQQDVESKSYFLHDVFTNVVFPDGDIAARSASEVRRQRLMRFAISVAAAMLGAILVVPSVFSFANNRRFLRETEDYARAVGEPGWDSQLLSKKLAAMRAALERLREIDKARTEGTPSGMGFTMYQGEAVYTALRSVYVSTLERAFVIPCKQRLEDRLEDPIDLVDRKRYLRDRHLLKMYLMLSDIEHLDVKWATGQFTALCAEVLGPISDLSEVELQKQLAGHVGYYLSLVKERKITAIPPRDELVVNVRKALQSMPVRQRYYNLFVDSLAEEKYDSSRDDPKYPPVTLEDVFRERPGVLKVIGSALFAQTKSWKEVEGPYTVKGRSAVLDNLAGSPGLMEQEQWLVPLAHDEQTEKIPMYLTDVTAVYVRNYIEQWTAWMADIRVRAPVDMKDAEKSYAELERTPWPYIRILRTLEDNTQWKRSGTVLDDQLIRVPNAFKKILEFGLPSGAGSAVSLTGTPLARYISLLDSLSHDIQKLEDESPDAGARSMADKFREARRQADALLQPLDEMAKSLLRPLLLNPLNVAETRLPPLATIPHLPGASSSARH